MLQITSEHHIHLSIHAVDFRKGINGLKAYCEQELNVDPFDGHVFVFCNSSKTAVKLLVYDGTGFWCCHKRFSQGSLTWWPTPMSPVVQLSSAKLLALLNQRPLVTHNDISLRAVQRSNLDALAYPDKSKEATVKDHFEHNRHRYESLPSNPPG